VAQRRQLIALGERGETPEATPCHILEEDTLDRVSRTEREDLLEGRLERVAHRAHRVTG
jgi:hypothetical protein